MIDEGIRIDRYTTRASTTDVQPRAHTTGRLANGRGGPGAYDHSVRKPAGLVKSHSLGGKPNLDALSRALPLGQPSKYLRETDNNREQALELFEWNRELSSAFYRVLGSFEITLRDSIDRWLANTYGREWFDDPRAGLDDGALGVIRKAKKNLREPFEPTDVVEALTLGFWERLLGRGGSMGGSGSKADYERTIWRPAVRNAFPNRRPLVRSEVYHSVRPLRELRNLVAHHQPILHLDLAREHERLLEVTGWMRPEMRDLISQETQVLRLLGEYSAAASRS